LLAVAAWALLCAGGAAGQERMPVGERVHLTPGDLPTPYATRSVANSSRRIGRPEGALPVAPPGFTVNLFAGGLDHARWLAVAENGDVFLAEPNVGRITLLRDADGDGVAESRSVWARGIRGVHGLAFHKTFLYAADSGTVWRYPYKAGALKAAGGKKAVSREFALGTGHGHWTRNLAFGPDGKFLYVTVGSRGNVAEEPEPRATVQRFAVNRIGGLYNQSTFASGLRNPVGVAFRPGSDDLYVVVNERDGLGDGLVPDYLTRVQKGGFYGWPYAYIGAHPDPNFGRERPDKVAETITPDVLFRSHSAPLGLVFYDGEQFPAEYRGDAFVALHGSWNAARPTGYVVVRVPFEAGRPLGWYETFASGFWIGGEKRARVWGRPVGLAVAADGSLLVADDVSQSVWRISHQP
jgi:glucose/arabinose dehydrogenase